MRQKSVSLARTIAPSVPSGRPVSCTNGRARWWGGGESRGRTSRSLPPAIASKTAHFSERAAHPAPGRRRGILRSRGPPDGALDVPAVCSTRSACRAGPAPALSLSKVAVAPAARFIQIRDSLNAWRVIWTSATVSCARGRYNRYSIHRMKYAPACEHHFQAHRKFKRPSEHFLKVRG